MAPLDPPYVLTFVVDEVMCNGCRITMAFELEYVPDVMYTVYDPAGNEVRSWVVADPSLHVYAYVAVPPATDTSMEPSDPPYVVESEDVDVILSGWYSMIVFCAERVLDVTETM